MADRSHLSIGEVLSLLQDDFPDVTISKIRFLESQGLLDPERTPSGYRKFYEADIERLRWILRHQRDHFLPLKVIKDRLEESSARGLTVPPDEPAAGQADGPSLFEASPEPVEPPGPSVAPPVSAPAVAAAPAPDEADLDYQPIPTPGRNRPAPRPFPVFDPPADSVARPPATPPATAIPAPTPLPAPAAPAPAAAVAPVRPALPAPELRPSAVGSTPLPRPGSVAGAPSAAPPAPAPPAAPAPPPPTVLPAPAPARVAVAARPELAAGGSPLDPGPSTASFTLEELAAASGLDHAALAELAKFNLITGRKVGGDTFYDADELVVCRMAAGFLQFGIEARHLRMYKVSADREAGFIEQVVMPLLKQRNPTARRQAADNLGELARLGELLRSALLRGALRDHTDLR